jgi:hypothetical protein
VLEIANAASPAAIRRAIELTKHRDSRIALKAIEIVLNRGLGLPRQMIDLNDVTERPAIIITELLNITPRGITRTILPLSNSYVNFAPLLYFARTERFMATDTLSM